MRIFASPFRQHHRHLPLSPESAATLSSDTREVVGAGEPDTSRVGMIG